MNFCDFNASANVVIFVSFRQSSFFIVEAPLKAMGLHLSNFKHSFDCRRYNQNNDVEFTIWNFTKSPYVCAHIKIVFTFVFVEVRRRFSSITTYIHPTLAFFTLLYDWLTHNNRDDQTTCLFYKCHEIEKLSNFFFIKHKSKFSNNFWICCCHNLESSSEKFGK
jgi:hypothetical protein